MRTKINLLIALLLMVAGQLIFAGSAKWNLNPTSNYWNNAQNWTPATVPNGPNDTATFSVSNMTGVSLDRTETVSSVVFSSGASAFTLTLGDPTGLFLCFFPISGPGVINNSGIVQELKVIGVGLDKMIPNTISFSNNATAGALTQYTAQGGYDGEDGGEVHFLDNATAGSAVVVNQAGINGDSCAGHTVFYDSSSAGDGTFTNEGASVTGVCGGYTYFYDTSNAGTATFTNDPCLVNTIASGSTIFFNFSGAASSTFICNGAAIDGASAGSTGFWDTSTADNATLIVNGGSGNGNGGSVYFIQNSTGGTARVKVFGNGKLTVSGHYSPGVTIGSLEGDGLVSLGSNNLTIGSNNLGSAFAGVIEDSGSISKTGTGTLIVTNANSYTGGTTVEGGFLLINNVTGSGTGTGVVRVNAGNLGGNGKIRGTVIVGTGGGSGAGLAPGKNSVTPGALAIGKTLLLMPDATYRVTLNSSEVAADKVSARGVRIRSAQIALLDLATGVLPPGTVFTVIENTSPNPILGTFSNLVDGSTITVRNNTYQASYEGGDGNDLTLTVVP
jgi:autotransporter-associated beta strand protein